MQNKGGKTKLVIDTQKHPMNDTRCTKPGAYSDTPVHRMQSNKRIAIRLDISSIPTPSLPSIISPHGTTIKGAVTEITNVINNRTVSAIHELFGSACNTSPLKVCVGENKILTKLDMTTYAKNTRTNPTLVAKPTLFGIVIDSRKFNMNGTTPYPNTTTPNQLLASLRSLGHKLSVD